MTPIRILLLALLAVASAHATQMYSWTDANGTRHFSDRPPPGATEAKRSILPAATTPPQERDEGTDSEAQDATSDRDAQAQAACDQARHNLDVLRSDVPVRLNEDDDVFLDDAQREEQIERAARQVEFYCN